MKRIPFFHEDKLFLAILLYRMDVISFHPTFARRLQSC